MFILIGKMMINNKIWVFPMVFGVFLSRTIGNANLWTFSRRWSLQAQTQGIWFVQRWGASATQRSWFSGPERGHQNTPHLRWSEKTGYPIPSHDHNLIFAIQLPSLVGKSWYKSSIFRQTIEIWHRWPPGPGMTWVHLGNSPWWLPPKF